MEFCSRFEQMYYIGIVLRFCRGLVKEFLSDADSMPVRSLDGSSFGRLIIDYCGCKIIIRPLNGLFISVSKFLWRKSFPRPHVLSLSNEPTRFAQLIFGYEGEVGLSLSDVAVTASLDGVWIVVRDGFLLLPWIESEYSLGVALQSLLSPCHCLVARSGGILRLSDLYDGAPAVPSVRWVVGLPERVGHGQCDTVERRVLRAHLIISGGAVLKVVSVSILGVLFPFCRHLGRGVYEIVLSVEIILIVCLVYFLNVIIKLSKRLSIAVLIEEGWEGLVELVKGLDPGEDVVGPREPPVHGLGHGYFLKSLVEDVGMG